MEEVRHDVLGDAAVGTDKILADAQEVHVGTLVEEGEHLVDLKDFAALRIDSLAAWKNIEQKNLGLRQLGAEFVDDRRDAVDHLLGGVAAARVVRADHDNGDLGADVLDVAVVEPPQDVLCSIAADAEVHGVALGVILRPNLLASAFPAVRDRVADKDQIDVALSHALVERLMSLHPAAAAGLGVDGRMSRLVGCLR